MIAECKGCIIMEMLINGIDASDGDTIESDDDSILPYLTIEQKTGNVVSMSKEAETFYGYATDELLNMAQIQCGSCNDFQLHRKKDGTIFPVKLHDYAFSLNGEEYSTTIIRQLAISRNDK